MARIGNMYVTCEDTHCREFLRPPSWVCFGRLLCPAEGEIVADDAMVSGFQERERNLSTRVRQRSLEFYVANTMAAAACASRRGVFAAA
jgi:hypothetical protein